MYGGKWWLLFLVFVAVGAWAQEQKKTKSELERERKASLEKIKEAEGILAETEKKKKVSVGQLNALNHQIKAREGLMASIKAELLLLDDEMVETNSIVESLEGDLEKLKKEYAAMAYAAYKANQGYNKLTFIFSSGSFNQLLMRLKYMKQYSQARQTQAREIGEVKMLLIRQVTDIEAKKAVKDSLLRQQLAESQNLDKLKRKQDDVVKTLEQKENNIRAELAETRKAVARVDRIIDNLIKREIAKASAAGAKKSTRKIALTPAGTKLSTSFEGTRNSLPWPVASGFITQKFGRQKHPTLRGILINNKGVNIQTNENEHVNAVYQGTVAKVAFVAGMGNVVVIKHGDYFTLYSKLKSVSVKNGQQVASKEKIGTVLTDKDGISEVHFEIWKNLVIQNPENWLSRK